MKNELTKEQLEEMHSLVAREMNKKSHEVQFKGKSKKEISKIMSERRKKGIKKLSK